MKLQCSCGAKYVFDATPEMLQNPVKFICPSCGLDASDFVNELIRQGTKAGDIRIATPLIAMRKNEIVRLGVELGAPFHVSWSCYSGESEACGVCESCVLRLRAFREAGAVDPIPYAVGK